jgi:hypothetical protein
MNLTNREKKKIVGIFEKYLGKHNPYNVLQLAFPEEFFSRSREGLKRLGFERQAEWAGANITLNGKLIGETYDISKTTFMDLLRKVYEL